MCVRGPMAMHPHSSIIILCINTGRIISGHNTAAAAAATIVAAGTASAICAKDAAHLFMHCLNQRHDSLLFRHFLMWCTAVGQN